MSLASGIFSNPESKEVWMRESRWRVNMVPPVPQRPLNKYALCLAKITPISSKCCWGFFTSGRLITLARARCSASCSSALLDSLVLYTLIDFHEGQPGKDWWSLQYQPQVTLFSQGVQNPIAPSYTLLSGYFQTRFVAKHLLVNVTQGTVQSWLSQAWTVHVANLAASSFWTKSMFRFGFFFFRKPCIQPVDMKILYFKSTAANAQPGSHHD